MANISFMTNLPKVAELQKDYQTLVKNLNGDTSDGTPKWFDKTGFCGLPKQNYNIAVGRLDIQIDIDKISDTSDDSGVTIQMSLLTEEEGKYTDDFRPDSGKKQLSIDKFLQLSNAEFYTTYVSNLFSELSNWESGVAEEKTLSQLLADAGFNKLSDNTIKNISDRLTNSIGRNLNSGKVRDNKIINNIIKPYTIDKYSENKRNINKRLNSYFFKYIKKLINTNNISDDLKNDIASCFNNNKISYQKLYQTIINNVSFLNPKNLK